MGIKCPFCESPNYKLHQRNRRSEASNIYRCLACNRCFSGRRFTPYAGTRLEPGKIVRVLHSLCEGVLVRATERLVEVNRDTVLRMLGMAGDRCQSVLDQYIRYLRPRFLQADELWTFVFKKEKRKVVGDPAEWGDQYIWLALDSETKLLISHLVGKRDAANAALFVDDINRRLRPMWRCQLTTDGFKPYIDAVESAFGADIDYAQLVKIMGKPQDAGPGWYGPAKVLEIVPTKIAGEPDEAHICTSHVERSNLSFRTQLRRFTRLALGFSKNLDNLKAAVAVYVAYYNFCRVHMTLRVTPGMESGLTDHVWTIEELLRKGLRAEGQAA
jgi:transposase-like protein/IS1 family transposase